MHNVACTDAVEQLKFTVDAAAQQTVSQLAGWILLSQQKITQQACTQCALQLASVITDSQTWTDCAYA